MRALVVFVSGLMLAAPAFAQASDGMTGSGAQLATSGPEIPENATSTAEGGEGAERRICRRVETATGSRMSYRRLCLTAEQWRNFNRQN